MENNTEQAQAQPRLYRVDVCVSQANSMYVLNQDYGHD